MPFPISLPYTFGTLSGIVPASDLDANYTALLNGLNGISSGGYPLTNVSVTGGTWAGSAIGVAYGGTGQTSTPTSGQLLIGNGTGYNLSTLTAGTGISISNGVGSITIASTSTATVSSVDVSGGSTGLTTSGGPITTSGTITLAGTLNVANGGTGVTTNTGTGSVVLSVSPVLTTPNLGTPSAATLTNATGLPLTTGTTGTLPTSKGGTNITSYATGDLLYASATNTLSKLSATTNGYVLTLSGGVPTWAASAGSGGITINTSTITGGTTGRILYDNAGTVGEKPVTGTGNVVLDTSPTLIAPALGTPASVVLTNATGLPVGGISATGTPSATTYLRGDGTWATVSGGSGTVTSVDVSGGATGLTTSGGPITSSGTITLAGTLAIANGGTGQTTASAALNALGGVSTGKAIAMAIVFGG